MSFLSSPSQALFGLAIAAVNDKTLNKESFAIVGDHWDTLDFGEIEKDLAARLTDDDIKAVLWCIDAGNRVKKLSLAHCVNITGAGLEPLRGSTIIEQIDLSLAGKHQNPALIEPWHPPARIVSLTIPFAPPISCELVLPILDSIIERGHLSSLKHLQFPMAWRTTKWYHEGREHSNPNLAFVYFLMRYNQMLMNRGIVSCFHCSRNLSSSGYELVGSSIGNERGRFTFGNQNHTCSQCMKTYCYRCNDEDAGAEIRSIRIYGYGDFMLERCKKCEREQCVECTEMYQCDQCEIFFCMDCKASTECSNYSDCGNRVCSECSLGECYKCQKEVCCECSQYCGSCEESICNFSCGGAGNWCSLGADGCSHMCDDCASRNTCQQCKEAFCCLSECHKCKKEFCHECTQHCVSCGSNICNINFGGVDNWCSLGTCGCNHMCDDCASFNTCQKCKQAFCCNEGSGHCETCNQTFCRDCVAFRNCDGFVPRRNAACIGEHCVDCPDEVFVELARTCAECNKEPCDACRNMESNSASWLRCTRCFRTSCHTWQAEKKMLIEEELKESRKGKGSGEA